MAGGRPLLFENKEELKNKIKTYFDSCFEMQWKERPKRDENGSRIKGDDGVYLVEPYKELVMVQVPTISGLAVALDTSRQTLINYEDKEEFFDTIKGAKDFIESIQEKGLLQGVLNTTGTIFNLKNNFGWVDKTEIDSTSKNIAIDLKDAEKYTLPELLEYINNSIK